MSKYLKLAIILIFIPLIFYYLGGLYGNPFNSKVGEKMIDKSILMETTILCEGTIQGMIDDSIYKNFTTDFSIDDKNKTLTSTMMPGWTRGKIITFNEELIALIDEQDQENVHQFTLNRVTGQLVIRTYRVANNKSSVHIIISGNCRKVVNTPKF